VDAVHYAQPGPGGFRKLLWIRPMADFVPAQFFVRGAMWFAARASSIVTLGIVHMGQLVHWAKTGIAII
jgi:hypothetical protein